MNLTDTMATDTQGQVLHSTSVPADQRSVPPGPAPLVFPAVDA